MDTYLKISANQGSFDVGTGAVKNLIDIDIPKGGVYDLSKSYLNVELDANPTYADAAHAGCVPNMFFSLATDLANQNLHHPSGGALIKNAHMSAHNVGELENLRQVSALRGALGAYEYNVAEQNDDVGKLAHFEFNNLYHIHPCNEINKDGVEASVNKSQDIRIPLGDVFNFAKVAEAYDTNKYGQTRIHLETQFAKIGANDDSQAGWGTKKLRNNAANELISAMADITNNTGGAISPTKLVSEAAYASLDECPFFVNMAIQISSKNDQSPEAQSLHRITSVVRCDAVGTFGQVPANQDVNKVEITFTPALGALADTKSYTLMKILRVADTIPTFAPKVKNVELVAYLAPGAQPPANYTYTSYMSEADSFPATTRANRLYQIPAATKNVYVVVGNSPTQEARSGDTHLASYRFSIDNKEITPRPVRVGSSIHYDLINQVYKNNGANVHSLLEKSFDVQTGVFAGVKNQILAFPVPFKAVPQSLQMELSTDGGNLVGSCIVYFEVVKQK